MRRLLPKLAVALACVLAFVVLKLTLFAADPLPVRTATVARGRVEQTVSNSRAGTVKARRRARLSPELGGRVVALPHLEGSRVARGDLLLRVDDELARARLEVAERERSAAEAQRAQACLAAERAARERERTARLAEQGIVSADLLDQVGSAAETAQAGCTAAAAVLERVRASAALARAEVGKHELRAPFDGVVAEVSIEIGEWTTPSPPAIPIPAVVDVIDTASLYVAAPMDEVDSARIRAGQAARLTIDSHPGRSFPGHVTRVAPYVLDVEAQNRTVEIEVELDDSATAATLLPGTSADAEVVLEARDGVLRIPTPALLEGGRVLVVEAGRLAERRVRVGIKNWDWSEVASGLAEGDAVVLSLDRPEIKAGARVRVEASPSPSL